MNKEDFQRNRHILKVLSTDMLNQMHNMFDQLAVAEKRIENARREGYDEGYQARCAETVMCKDCKHRPRYIEGHGDGDGGFNIEFPDYMCPCQCEDGWYNWMPKDDWFCGNGVRKEE